MKPWFSLYLKRAFSGFFSIRIRSFSGPYFPEFGLNTDQKNSEYGHFSCRCYRWIATFPSKQNFFCVVELQKQRMNFVIKQSCFFSSFYAFVYSFQSNTLLLANLNSDQVIETIRFVTFPGQKK